MSAERRKKIQELFEKGSRDLTKAQRLASEDPQKKQLLASALRAFEETTRINPKFILGYRKIASVHEEGKNQEEAVKALEKILELQPHDETAILKISELRKALGEPENAALLELQTRYDEVQELLRKYEDASPDSGVPASVIWEGTGKARLESDEELVLLFRNVDMTINRVNIQDGTFIATNHRIILEGMRVYGSQTGSAMARHYEYRRGRLKSKGEEYPESFLGISLSYEDINDAKLVWFGNVPTLHIIFQEDGHAGISGISPGMVEKSVAALNSCGVSVSHETIKMCASWVIILLPLASIFSLFLFLM